MPATDIQHPDRDDHGRTSGAASPMVRATEVVKRFPDGTVALAGVSVACEPGELLVLVGPSGCGKTTLLRSIAGLETPTSGRIHVAGRDVTDVPPQHRGVAMVFQHYALYPDKTVRDNIEFPLRMARLPGPERRRRSDEVARLLQIDELMERRPAQLSGGQKQRVGIGRALVRGPQVLLMDEPLSNLDAKLRVEMRAELRALHQALGTTIVYVTHDQTEALTLADRICVLRDGRIEQLDRPEVVFGRPETPFVATFLGGMNLVPGTLVGGTLRHRGQQVLDVPSSHSGPVELGVRPEDLHLGIGDDTDLRAEGRVVLRELLGTNAQLHVALSDEVVLRVLVPAERVTGERVRLYARQQDLHLFASDADDRRVPVSAAVGSGNGSSASVPVSGSASASSASAVPDGAANGAARSGVPGPRAGHGHNGTSHTTGRAALDRESEMVGVVDDRDAEVSVQVGEGA